MDGTETNKRAMVGSLIKSERLLGIKHWALYEPFLKRITIYKYVGFEPDTGTYVFQTMRGPMAVLHRNFYQLGQPNFKPFCIDIEAVEASLDKEKLGSHIKF